MLHRSKETEAYQHLLEVLKERIEDHAERLSTKATEPRYHGQKSRDTLEKYCTEVTEDGYAPRFVMIDGDDAERGAIETAFPGTPVRLCQFHFMQACISKITSQFGRSKEGSRKTDRVLQCLRKLQRCPNESDWPSAYQCFQDEIDSIANDRGEVSAALVRYFDRSWFSERWRPYCVDYGIPVENTRDGPWSTNNYAEAAFRTFDRVFLCCRVNKRCVRLFAICRVQSLNRGQARPLTIDNYQYLLSLLRINTEWESTARPCFGECHLCRHTHMGGGRDPPVTCVRDSPAISRSGNDIPCEKGRKERRPPLWLFHRWWKSVLFLQALPTDWEEMRWAVGTCDPQCCWSSRRIREEQLKSQR